MPDSREVCGKDHENQRQYDSKNIKWRSSFMWVLRDMHIHRKDACKDISALGDVETTEGIHTDSGLTAQNSDTDNG